MKGDVCLKYRCETFVIIMKDLVSIVDYTGKCKSNKPGFYVKSIIDGSITMKATWNITMERWLIMKVNTPEFLLVNFVITCISRLTLPLSPLPWNLLLRNRKSYWNCYRKSYWRLRNATKTNNFTKFFFSWNLAKEWLEIQLQTKVRAQMFSSAKKKQTNTSKN